MYGELVSIKNRKKNLSKSSIFPLIFLILHEDLLTFLTWAEVSGQMVATGRGKQLVWRGESRE